ncbi:MAG: hypothetical protein JKY48_02540 [Flavobacteriales bacterium]|nr:hypothetical protein [Flavobacteriales bacterium]
MKNRFYTAFGLKFRSNFELYSMAPSSKLNGYDLSIVKVKATVEVDAEECFVKKHSENSLMYHVKGIATFLIRDKENIEIQQYHTDNDLVESVLMEKVMLSYLTMLGYYVCSGAAILLNGKARLFLGVPGVGLSSIVAKFYQNGSTVLSDAHIVIKQNGTNFVLIPSCTYSKLWSSVVQELKLEGKVKQAVREKLTKYYVDLLAQEYEESYDISEKCMVEIDPIGKFDLKSKELTVLETIKEFKRHLIIDDTEQSTLNKKEEFKLLTFLASKGRTWKVSRPTAVYNLSNLVSFIQSATYE